MRLIYADALADALFEKRKNYPQWVADTIGSMPEAVVRCKDCKFQVDRGRRYHECDKHFLLAKDDWYCADGERKDGDGDDKA